MAELVLKEKLVEELGVHFEKRNKQLPPLAARIYALLILCPKSGHSFEELMEMSQSSKSSVSTNLNLLLSNGIVEYFTKTGERKRYFRLSKNYLKVSLKEYRDLLADELQLMEKISDFNMNYNYPKYCKHKEYSQLYIEYLQKQHSNLENTINKMNQL